MPISLEQDHHKAVKEHAPPFWATLGEAGVLSIVVLWTTFLLQWRFGFNWADEGLMWYVSQRTALGQIPIRDFFSYDPGRYYWSAFFFKVLHGNGLLDQIVADGAFGVVGLSVLYFTMVRIRMGRQWRIAVLLIVAIMLAFPRHKIYEQALSLICVAIIAFVMSKPDVPTRWLILGITTGLAAFIGRNSGVYFAAAGLFLLLLLKLSSTPLSAARTLLHGSLGIAIGYSPMLLMLCSIHGFASAFYESVLFTPNWQQKLPIPFPWHVHLRGLEGFDALHVRAVSILCLVVPATYLFSVWKLMKAKADPLLCLACASSIAGIPFLHHAFSRADFFHIAQGIVPFAISAVSLAAYYWQADARRAGAVIITSAFGLVLAAWLPYEPLNLYEPLTQYLRAKPGTLEQVEISGKQFYVEAQQAEVMRATEEAFRTCGSVDGSFLQAPYYPGLYPYLQTRAPFWELFYLYPRDESFQKRHIEGLEQNRVSLVLLNRETAIDGRDGLRIERTYPELVSYILEHYRRSATKLPDGFELYYSPAWCPNMR